MTKAHSRLYSLILPTLFIGTLQLTGCLSRGVDAPPPGGAYISTSAGANFDQSALIVDDTGTVTGNIAELSLQTLHRSVVEPSRIYTTAGGSGLFISDNGGGSWRQIPQPLAIVTAVAELASGPLLVSGASDANAGVVIRSLDNGKSWEQVLTIPGFHKPKSSIFEVIKPPPPPSVFVSTLIINPFHDDQVYATTSTGDILTGEQSGKVWKSISRVTGGKKNPFTNQALTPIKKVVPSPHADGEVMLITTGGQLIRVVNGLQEPIDTPATGILDVSYVAQFPAAIFVGSARGAIISRDRGLTWEELNLPISTSANLVNAIVRVSPTNVNRMFVAIDSIIYRSEDGGETWNALSLGLPNHVVTDISIDPSNAARVLLTTAPVPS